MTLEGSLGVPRTVAWHCKPFFCSRVRTASGIVAAVGRFVCSVVGDVVATDQRSDQGADREILRRIEREISSLQATDRRAGRVVTVERSATLVPQLLTECIHQAYNVGVSVAFALLSFLESAPRHGYELKSEYDALFSAGKPLPFGQVYATLGRLERDGRIRLAAQEAGHGPERKCYEITDGGRVDLAAWLAEPVVPDAQAHNALFAKTVLAIRSGRSADAYLDRQRARHLDRMRELTALKRDGDLAVALVADHAIFHLEADLRWIDHARARLGRSPLEPVRRS